MKIPALLSILLIFSAATLFGESTDPQLLDGKMPAYTDSARASGVEGVVVVEALVDEKGRVFAADVLQSVSPELDTLTVEAIMEWKFSPAMEDGKAVMKVVRIPVKFHLIDPLEESVKDAQDGAIAAK